jgi:hypothetical protein
MKIGYDNHWPLTRLGTIAWAAFLLFFIAALLIGLLFF